MKRLPLGNPNLTHSVYAQAPLEAFVIFDAVELDIMGVSPHFLDAARQYEFAACSGFGFRAWLLWLLGFLFRVHALWPRGCRGSRVAVRKVAT